MIVTDKRLLDILCCPSDRGELSLVAAEPSEPSLRCGQCGRSYPVHNGIPRFVSDDQYTANFSHEWRLHRTTQLDSASSALSERTFAEKTGWTPDDVRGRLVLDVGCGMGRFADVVLRWGGRVVGIELSYAVDSARANLAHHDGFTAIQASVFELPFRPECFDLIYSIGVLNHTPDPRKAFHCLPPLLRAGGEIAVSVYSLHAYPPDGIEERRDRVLRSVTTRMPARLLYALCRAACLVRIPFGSLWHMLLPGFVFHGLPKTHSYDSYDWRVLDTFNWYSPPYQFKHSYPEVFHWFREAGLVDIDLRDVEVAVRGRKRAVGTPQLSEPATCTESLV
ncbi:MAG: methyltransferase domain-containing protein [Candidatus Rokubacteria bacterium]|nr:methyltransferase domain-containing protein [Candidatus Rokubacteria bacterium]